MNYFYKFTNKKRINSKKYKMAQVTVYDLKDKVIGSYAWSHLQVRNREEEIQEKVTMLIREYEISRAWGSIKLPIDKTNI